MPQQRSRGVSVTGMSLCAKTAARSSPGAGSLLSTKQVANKATFPFVRPAVSPGVSGGRTVKRLRNGLLAYSGNQASASMPATFSSALRSGLTVLMRLTTGAATGLAKTAPIVSVEVRTLSRSFASPFLKATALARNIR